jgi:hypothetical protein
VKYVHHSQFAEPGFPDGPVAGKGRADVGLTKTDYG